MARAVIDAAIEVHCVLCHGFGENVYEPALCIELELRDIAQVLAYLKAIERQLGLLINFHVARLASGVLRPVA